MGMRLIAHAAASVPETQAVIVAEATLPVVEVLPPATQSLQAPNRVVLCCAKLRSLTLPAWKTKTRTAHVLFANVYQ
ncbi:hypothetical protein JG688_00017805 [Phytophthora aleatoria]|uniref:Uncharacterized protein n=1 Tax=Phytophthora aleatoria TaxID=2496075 RepID=A0A8J5MBI7_9STRA|nr:hypothetical protein JG688_00017805 [Phytophthora aleatoria]